MEQITDKLYNWASIFEEQTRQQALRISRLPIIFPHVAVMPDTHLGKGAAIGLAIPTVDSIIPAAVGVDIGCGMMAVRTQWARSDIEAISSPVRQGYDLSTLRELIERAIPVSMGGYNIRVKNGARHRVEELEQIDGSKDAYDVSPRWPLQLGTLGSGNHFIEVTVDEQDRVWLFLHSGSRGVGNKLATRYIAAARALELKRVPRNRLEDPDLAYLLASDDEFHDYMRVLNWAQHFAKLNRVEMMNRVELAISDFMDEAVRAEESVNCHHNYTEKMPAALLSHYGCPDGTENIWLSRKGAIDASTGQLGLIPGSMGDLSYVVVGLGNYDALWTAPHGAGRQMSRGEAKRELEFSDLEERMKGIEWRHSSAFLDEHPLAYKPIDTVMADSADLVRIHHTFKQILNVKGD